MSQSKMNENDFPGCAKFTEYMRQQMKHRGQEQTDVSTGFSLEVFCSLANDDVKVNQTQRISSKLHSELDSFSGFWWKLQNLLQNYVAKIEEKVNVVENFYAMFQIQKQSVVRRCSSEKVFLKIWEISQEKSCLGVSIW